MPNENQNQANGSSGNGWPEGESEQKRFEVLIGAYDEYLANSFKLPPFNPDTWISSKGYKTLDDMLSLAAVRAPLNIIRDAVLYKGWRVVPAIGDKSHADYAKADEIAKALDYVLNNIVDESGNVTDFRQTLWEILYAVHTGFHVAEIVWRIMEEGPYAGRLGFSLFAHKPCQQIGFDVDTKTLAVRSLTSYTPMTGYSFGIPVEKVLRYTFAPQNGLPYGMGVGRSVYKHSWTIDFLYRFWNIALEQFGGAFILAKAPATSMALAQKVVSAIRQGAPGVLPQGVEAELMEMSGSGLAGFKAAVEHHAQQCAVGYLANTLTTGEGQRTGSMALGKVHQDTQDFGLGGRRIDVENVMAFQLIRRWVRYNYGPDTMNLCPRISLGDWDGGDMAQLAKAFQVLISSTVLHPGEPQIRERMNLAPIEPELREKLEKIWDNPTPAPSTIPPSDPVANPPADENDDRVE